MCSVLSDWIIKSNLGSKRDLKKRKEKKRVINDRKIGIVLNGGYSGPRSGEVGGSWGRGEGGDTGLGSAGTARAAGSAEGGFCAEIWSLLSPKTKLFVGNEGFPSVRYPKVALWGVNPAQANTSLSKKKPGQAGYNRYFLKNIFSNAWKPDFLCPRPLLRRDRARSQQEHFV